MPITREERNARRRERYRADPEKQKAYQKEWLRKNPENRRAASRRWRAKNPDKVRAYNQNYRQQEWWWKSQYGLTRDDYEALLQSQNGVCAICKKEEKSRDSRSGKVKGFHVDHNHANGKVRGLLCDLCNKGLGLFRDSPQFLESAIIYLEKHGDYHD